VLYKKKIIPTILLLLTLCSTSLANIATFVSYHDVGVHPLIVVHASSVFNKKKRGKKALDHLISRFKNKNRKVYYLSSEDDSLKLGGPLPNWYLEDENPTDQFYSYGGENNLTSKSAEFTVAGGFLGAGVNPDDAFPEGTDFKGCLTNAIAHLIKNHFENYSKPLTINISVNSVYTPKRDGKDLIDHFNNTDVRGFIAWLITDDDFRALKDYPNIEHNVSNLPFDLEKVMAENYQCNYRLDQNCSYLVYDSFWNFFEKSPNWRINAPIGGTGVTDGVSYQIKLKGKLVAFVGSEKKKVILNFID